MQQGGRGAIEILATLAVSLRSQTHAYPMAIGMLPVLQPVVQAAGAALPEFEFIRNHAVSTPP